LEPVEPYAAIVDERFQATAGLYVVMVDEPSQPTAAATAAAGITDAMDTAVVSPLVQGTDIPITTATPTPMETAIWFGDEC
jgi:hypothetical protein